MKKAFSVISALFLLMTLARITSACENGNCGTKLNFEVDHVATGKEKVTEKLNLFFKFNKEEKEKYYQFLTEKRLAELSWSIKSDNIDFVEPTASRYSTYLGKLENLVISNHLTNEKQSVIEMSFRHTEILSGLQSNFKYDSGWWLAVQHCININKDVPNKLKSI